MKQRELYGRRKDLTHQVTVRNDLFFTAQDHDDSDDDDNTDENI